MTKVNVQFTGNKAISSIDGFGVDELRKVLEKMSDGYAWHLEIYSEASFQHSVQLTGLTCPECDSRIMDSGYCMMGHWCGKPRN